MKVLVSGSTGFVGSPLVHYLVAKGHDVSRLVRRDLGSVEPEVHWDPAAGTIESSALGGNRRCGPPCGRERGRSLDRAQEGPHSGKPGKRDGAALPERLPTLIRLPRVLICASGLDYYGDRGDALVSEDTGPGSGFLAEVTDAWEAATKPATDAGIRVVRARLGMVVGNGGGALARMLPAFRLGLGGPIRRRPSIRQLALTHRPRPRGSLCPGDRLPRWTGQRLDADAGNER